MLRIFARWWAKRKYIFNQEVEAVTHDLNAGLALKLAGEKRALIEKFKADADEIDANIEGMDRKLEKGFWECESGHENTDAPPVPQESGHEIHCSCGRPVRLIKRDQMTGQEKYESDKERSEAEKIAADKRAQAKAQEEQIAESDRTAKYFKGLAANSRTIADRIKSL